MKNRSLVAAIVASAALFTVSATLTGGVIAAPNKSAGTVVAPNDLLGAVSTPKKDTGAAPVVGNIFDQIGAAKNAKNKKAPKPAIGNSKITPKALPGHGGTVNLRVKVNPKKATVQRVRGYAILNGETVGTQPRDLTLGANNFWEGAVSVPANNRNKKHPARIFVEVHYAEGGPLTKKVGNVKLDRYAVEDDSMPPPPPNL